MIAPDLYEIEKNLTELFKAGLISEGDCLKELQSVLNKDFIVSHQNKEKSNNLYINHPNKIRKSKKQDDMLIMEKEINKYIDSCVQDKIKEYIKKNLKIDFVRQNTGYEQRYALGIFDGDKLISKSNLALYINV